MVIFLVLQSQTGLLLPLQQQPLLLLQLKGLLAELLDQGLVGDGQVGIRRRLSLNLAEVLSYFFVSLLFAMSGRLRFAV